MAWVEQIGSHSWRVRFADHDGQVRSVSGFASTEHARDYAATVARRPWVDPAAGRVTLEAWTARWLPTLTVSERTEENYRRDLRKHVLPRWGECQLAAISAGEVNGWAAQLHTAGYAPATVSSLVKLLSRLLTDAVDARLIAENPVRRHRRRGPRVLQPHAERVWATAEQVVRVADAGSLHESGSRMWLGPPKSAASIRVIALPPFLIALLREHLNNTDGIPVFTGPKGGWLRRSNVDRRILRPAADGTLRLP